MSTDGPSHRPRDARNAPRAVRLYQHLHSDPGEPLPTVLETNVTVVDSRCTDAAEHEASIAYDADVAHVDGVIALHDACLDLFVDVQNGFGLSDRPDDSFTIDVDYVGPTDESEPCDCPGEATYEATVSFDGTPASVDVFHVDKRERGAYREGPFAHAELD